MDNKSDILRASAFLHGQHGDHVKALEILIHELKDFDGAFRYCVEHPSTSCTSEKSKGDLFHIVLGIYFEQIRKNDSKSDLYKRETIKLLNSPLATFDSIKVLSLIPNEWSVANISDFLIKSFRTSHHEKFCTSIERGLLESESKRLQLVQAKNAFEEPYLITSATTCDVCSNPFGDFSGIDGDDDYPVANNPFESTSSPESIPASSYSSLSSNSQIESNSKDIILIPSVNQLIHAKCFNQLDPKYDINSSCCNSYSSR